MILKSVFSFNFRNKVFPVSKWHTNKACFNRIYNRTYCERYVASKLTADDASSNATLREKFINFLKTSEKYKPYFVPENTEFIVQRFRFDVNKVDSQMSKTFNDFLKFSDEDLLYSVVSLSSKYAKPGNLNKQDHNNLLKSLDNEFCKRFDTMTVESVLRSFGVWLTVLSHRINILSCYSLFINKMISWNTYRSLNVLEVILCLFYVSYHKIPNERKAAVKLCLKRLDSLVEATALSVLDLCIISDSAFRTGTRISDKLLAANVRVLKMHLHEIIHDPIVLVSLTKPLRHAHYVDYDLLSHIAGTLSNSAVLTNLKLLTKVHILALYAEALINEKEFFRQIITLCLQDLKNRRSFLAESKNQKLFEHSKKSSVYLLRSSQYETRLKDITRFLWSVSYLGWTISTDDIEKLLIPELKDKFAQNEHLKSPQDLVGSILSLWILGTFDKFLLSYINSKYIGALKDTGKDRLKARLLLLLTCVQIEKPSFLKNEHIALFDETTPLQDAAEVDKHLQNRHKLKEIYEAVKCLSNHLGLSTISCCFTIPHLHILGIELHTVNGMTVNIELLDSTVCLHNSDIPHGLMKLKLRLLNSKGHNVLIIKEKQLEELETSSELFSYVEDELKKVISCRV